MLSSQYASGPSPGRSSCWPAIMGIGCAVVLIILLWTAYKAVNTFKSAASSDNRDLADAMMMITLAGEDVIRDSATSADLSAIIADTSNHTGKWLVIEGTVSWLQNPAGDPIQPGQEQPDEQIVYWLDGPVALMDVSKARPLHASGEAVRAYGRCIETKVDRMGLSASGQQALAAMPGGSSQTIVVFLAKWVESP